MTLTPQWLDELRARTVLSTLIGKSVKVIRAGREYKACCPFHNEKTPSFTINDDKGFYHCFGCGAHGDAIRWMTDQRGLGFMDAVKELADTAGMQVPAADPQATRRAEQAHSLRDVTQASAIWFREILHGTEGASARDYLAKRGISKPIADAFSLGLAPDSRGRLREVLSKYGEALAIEAGMLIALPDDAPASHADPSTGTAKQKRQPYDRFRGRLMIPIRDARSRIIAFGGRILGDGEPKYLNSPETPLFDKGRTLFNLDRAAPAARKAGRLIVVEGYMDVIALAQAGIDEVVAPLGTALTEDQIALAWRHAEVPMLAFDGDAAGQRAALRAATRALPILKPGHSLSFLTMPAGQDPDDVVRGGGAAAFDALAGAAMPLVDLLWQTAMTDRRDDTPEARAAVRARLNEWADAITDRDVAAHYRQAFRERLDIAFFQRGNPPPNRQFQPGTTKWRSRAFERPPTRSLRSVGDAIDVSLVNAIVVGLLRYPDRLEMHAATLERLAIADQGVLGLLGAMIDISLDHPGLDSAALLTILESTAMHDRAQQLLRGDRMQFSFTQNAVQRERPFTAQETEDADVKARRDLDEAISTAVAWPELNDALAKATEAMQVQMDAASFAEQQRLLGIKAELAARLAQIAES